MKIKQMSTRNNKSIAKLRGLSNNDSLSTENAISVGVRMQVISKMIVMNKSHTFLNWSSG